MPGLLSRMFRKKGKTSKTVNGLDLGTNGTGPVTQADPWEKTTVRREDVVDLLKACCDELKSRALDSPLFLLPFRPSSDLSSTKTFIRKYFAGGRPSLHGNILAQELRLTDILVLSGVLRWIWTRLEGGIVGWESYELFAQAERDCNYSRDAFNLLIPLSVESELHTAVILDFFTFLASVAAHAKSNGFSGQRLSRIAGWYAFDVKGSSSGFTAGYANWEKAANATEHLFLAYLRSIAPTPGQISAALPLSLSTLLSQTSYPPRAVSKTPIAPGATSILRVTLSVRNVSPTPFALLDRLARHSFVQTNPNERGDALEAIIEAQSEHGDPTKALTNECLRVLRLIAATNESDDLTAAFLRTPNSLGDKTWTRFADLGFEGLESEDSDDDDLSRSASPEPFGENRPRRRDYLGVNRPKTPSWGDFLVSGFANDGQQASGFSLPPDKLLPPINTTTLPNVNSSRRSIPSRDGYKSTLHELEKGEVKSVERSRVDDALWSVWMESLCGEELEENKAVFGRCVVAETIALDTGRRWIVVEEIVKGAETGPELLPPLKQPKKIKSKKAKKAAEEELAKKRTQQRRSTSDLVNNVTIGRDMRAQALARQSATLKSIKERGSEVELPTVRRPSAEYNGRPSMHLGADVSRAMKWADTYDRGDMRRVDQTLTDGSRGVSRGPSPVRQTPRPSPLASQVELPKVEKKEDVKVTPYMPPTVPAVAVGAAVPVSAAKPQFIPPTSETSKPQTPEKRPVLLEPESSLKNDKSASPPSKFKKFFGGKSKEEKAAKRASRVASPIPPSPNQPISQPPIQTTQPLRPSPSPVRRPSPSPVRSPPTPTPDVNEWDSDFDGTHRRESEAGKPLDSPVEAETFPDTTEVTRTSEDSELDRWAQIRKTANTRALNRNVAPSNDDDIVVNIPRTRVVAPASPKRKAMKGSDEEEETVDARVARIRKRVQELTAGMGD